MSRPVQDLLARSKQLNERIDLIEEKLQRIIERHRSVEFSALGFLDSFLFYCVLLASVDEWFNSELPSLSILNRKLAPTSLLAQQVYLRMYRQGIVLPSLASPINAFNVSSPVDRPIKFDCARVHWTIASGLYKEEKCEVLAILRKLFSAKDGPSVASLGFTLMQHECLALFLRSANKLSVNIRKEDEIALSAFFKDLLKQNSTAELVTSIHQTFSDPAVKEQFSNAGLHEQGSSTLWDLVKLLDVKFAKLPKRRTETSSQGFSMIDSDCVLSAEFARSFPNAV